MSAPEDDWRPSGPARLLLAAAVGPAPVAAAVERWAAAMPLDDLDPTSAELAGLVAQRLAEEGEPGEGELAGRLRGLRRRTAYVNRLALADLAVAVDSLDAAGVPTVLGGGLAVLGPYPDGACRALPDAELLVARTDAALSAEVLAGSGWVPADHGRWRSSRATSVALATRLRGTEPGWLDDLAQLAEPDRQTVEALGRPLPAVAPHVAVVEVAVAAVWPSPAPPVRWVADLHHLAPAVAIEPLVAHAAAHGAAHLVRLAVDEARACGAELPPAWSAALGAVPLGPVERAALEERAGPAGWEPSGPRLPRWPGAKRPWRRAR